MFTSPLSRRGLITFGAFTTVASFSSRLGVAQSPVITITKSDKTAVGFSPFSGSDGAAVSEAVKRDLASSNAFTLGAAGAGNYTVRGTSNGSSLRGQLSDPSGKVVLDKTYNGSLKQRAHEFADDIVKAVTGSKGFAGSKIAFVATRTGRKEIYTADADGSNVQQLTKDGAISVAPSLSANGRKLLYTGYQSGYADVYSIDLGSGGRSRLLKYPGTNSGAVYSPDGSRIAVSLSKDGNPELYVVGADGGSPNRLTTTAGVESSPTWSPNGSQIIYSSDSSGSPQLYKINASGGTPQLLRTGQPYNTEPNWSPDGSKVAFNVRQGGSFAVAILNLGGGGVRVVGEGQDPVWGPDSRHLLYAQGGSLVRFDTLSGTKVQVVSGVGRISEPAWSH